MVERAEIIEVVRQYLNTPFQYGGRTKRGADCVFLPQIAAKTLQIPGWKIIWSDKECHAYPRVREPGFMRRKLNSFVDRGILRRVELHDLGLADMVLRFGGLGHDHHVSMMSYDGMLIEARQKPEPRFPRGRIVECTITPLERASFMCGYQFRDVV